MPNRKTEVKLHLTVALDRALEKAAREEGRTKSAQAERILRPALLGTAN